MPSMYSVPLKIMQHLALDQESIAFLAIFKQDHKDIVEFW